MIKDKQAPQQTPTGSIPVVSPILHCLSMPVLVFWRRGFGYAFLSPKKIFLASIFATVLFSIIVWNEPWLKTRYFGASLFALAASALYLLNLATVVHQQTNQTAKHDQESGTSRISFLLPGHLQDRHEGKIHATEPLLTIVIGFLFWQNPLGKFLVISGIAFALKETIRAWLSIRIKKRMADHLTDVKEAMETSEPTTQHPLSSQGKTARERYQRHLEPEEESADS